MIIDHPNLNCDLLPANLQLNFHLLKPKPICCYYFEVLYKMSRRPRLTSVGDLFIDFYLEALIIILYVLRSSRTINDNVSHSQINIEQKCQ